MPAVACRFANAKCPVSSVIGPSTYRAVACLLRFPGACCLVPLQVTVDRSNRLVMVRGSGQLTDADLANAAKQFETADVPAPSFAQMCDLSGVSGVMISDEALQAWVASSLSHPPSRHAIVCSAAPVLNRVLDYIRLSRKQFQDVSIFPSVDQAAKWLSR